MTIIRDGAKLNKTITDAIAARASYRGLLLMAVNSSLWHATEHGDPSFLNRIYDKMDNNDQAALRIQISKVHVLFGLGLGSKDELPALIKPEERNAAQVAGAVFEIRQGMWRVLNKMDKPNAPELRAKFAKFVEDVLDTGTHKNFPAFFETNNIKQIQYFSDTQVIKRVMATIKAANRDSTDNRVVEVSPKLKAMLEKFESDLETFANANEHENPLPVAGKDKQARKARKAPATKERNEGRQIGPN